MIRLAHFVTWVCCGWPDFIALVLVLYGMKLKNSFISVFSSLGSCFTFILNWILSFHFQVFREIAQSKRKKPLTGYFLRIFILIADKYNVGDQLHVPYGTQKMGGREHD